MYGLIKCLARVPANDSKIAWRIKGPHIARRYFKRIVDPEMILFLVHCELEQIELSFYQRIIQRKIGKPRKKAQKVLKSILELIQAQQNIEKIDSISKPAQILLQTLDQQLKERRRIFPAKVYDIRQTREELNATLRNVELYVTLFITTHKLQDIIWDEVGVLKNQWDLLTKELIRKTYGEQFLEPIEDLDSVIELQNSQKGILGQIKKVLEGQNLAIMNPIIKQKLPIYKQTPPFVNATNCMKEEISIEKYIVDKYIEIMRKKAEGESYEEINSSDLLISV